MPVERTFDYDFLKLLLREKPNATMRELAQEVTEHERVKRKDPGYPAIKTVSIASAISRYAAEWGVAREKGGWQARPHGDRSQPWNNLPNGWDESTLIRRVRTLVRLARGEMPPDKAAVNAALGLARRLASEGKVIDLKPTGEPWERKARPDEVDSTGNLISFLARYPGLTDKTWQALSPAARRAASLHWLPRGDRVAYPAPEDLPLEDPGVSQVTIGTGSPLY